MYSNKKTIILIGTNSPGGINSVIQNIKKSKLRNNYDFITLISHSKTSHIINLLIYSLSILKLFSFFLYYKNLTIHLHISFNGSIYRKFFILLICKIFRKYTILHIHGSMFDIKFDEGSFWYCKINEYLVKNSDQIICLSKNNKVFIKKKFLKKSNIVKNFIKDNKTSIKVNFKNKNKFLFVGEISYRKGIDILIKSFKKHLLSNPNSTLTIVGAGNKTWEKKINRQLYFKNKIKFLGYLQNYKIPKLYSKCGVFVLPSRNEALPVSIIEALREGIPVISTDVGAISDLVSSSNGRLIKSNDENALLFAMNNIGNCNSKKYKLMCLNSRLLFLKSYSETACSQKLKKIYDNSFKLN